MRLVLIYVDGHERADVVEARGEFLKTMTSLGFFHRTNAPNEEMAGLLPDVQVSPEHENTIFWFHDESSYNGNDDEPTMWTDGTMQVLRPKGRGAGLMVSDVLEEKDGYLALSDAMYATIKHHLCHSQPECCLSSAKIGKATGTMNCLWSRWMQQSRWQRRSTLLACINTSGSLITRMVTQHWHLMLS